MGCRRVTRRLQSSFRHRHQSNSRTTEQSGCGRASGAVKNLSCPDRIAPRTATILKPFQSKFNQNGGILKLTGISLPPILLDLRSWGLLVSLKRLRAIVRMLMAHNRPIGVTKKHSPGTCFWGRVLGHLGPSWLHFASKLDLSWLRFKPYRSISPCRVPCGFILTSNRHKLTPSCFILGSFWCMLVHFGSKLARRWLRLWEWLYVCSFSKLLGDGLGARTNFHIEHIKDNLR